MTGGVRVYASMRKHWVHRRSTHARTVSDAGSCGMCRRTHSRTGWSLDGEELFNALGITGCSRHSFVEDMRAPGESFCSDCPDRESCMQGIPCGRVKYTNHINYLDTW